MQVRVGTVVVQTHADYASIAKREMHVHFF
jgi:hypothetical protein